MKRILIVALLPGVLVLLLAACSPIITSAGNATNVPAVTVEPMPTTVAIREAQVTSVEVRFSDMNPTQPHAYVRGTLSESCATLVEPRVSYADNTFSIKVLASTPSDRGCIQVITPFEQVIPLDITNLAQGTYTVVANGATTAFTIPTEPQPLPTPFQLVVYDSNHNIQVIDLNLPGFGLNPYFNGLIPQGASARGEAYVLDSTNSTNAVLVDATGIHDLSFIERPTLYGLAVYQESPDDLPRLAWGTEYAQASPNSTLEISSIDGSGRETLLTQEVSEPLLQLVPLFWSTDGNSLYFSKEPVGVGGYILFGGASNLYRIDVKTKEVSELIPLVPSDGPQICLDSISKDFRYVAEHCSEDFIRIRNLTSDGTANILLPDDLPSGHKHLGSSRFSPDGSRIAYAIAKGDPNNEQGWVVVSDTTVSNSKVILTSQAGSYLIVAGWLNDQTLLVQSTNMQDCSPYCSAELWMVDINGENQQKVADGSFITVIPYGSIPTPLSHSVPVPTSIGPATVSDEISSSAGQISAGYFGDANGQNSYITRELNLDKAETKQVNLHFVGPYPYPDDITVNLRVNDGEWINTKLHYP